MHAKHMYIYRERERQKLIESHWAILHITCWSPNWFPGLIQAASSVCPCASVILWNSAWVCVCAFACSIVHGHWHLGFVCLLGLGVNVSVLILLRCAWRMDLSQIGLFCASKKNIPCTWDLCSACSGLWSCCKDLVSTMPVHYKIFVTFILLQTPSFLTKHTFLAKLKCSTSTPIFSSFPRDPGWDRQGEEHAQ